MVYIRLRDVLLNVSNTTFEPLLYSLKNNNIGQLLKAYKVITVENAHSINALFRENRYALCRICGIYLHFIRFEKILYVTEYTNNASNSIRVAKK